VRYIFRKSKEKKIIINLLDAYLIVFYRIFNRIKLKRRRRRRRR